MNLRHYRGVMSDNKSCRVGVSNRCKEIIRLCLAASEQIGLNVYVYLHGHRATECIFAWPPSYLGSFIYTQHRHRHGVKSQSRSRPAPKLRGPSNSQSLGHKLPRGVGLWPLVPHKMARLGPLGTKMGTKKKRIDDTIGGSRPSGPPSRHPTLWSSSG